MRRSKKSLVASWLAAVSAALLTVSLARPAYAVPVRIGTEGFPAIDIAQRDSAGMLRLLDAADDDGDGVISFVADIDPLEDPVVHIKSGPSKSQSVILLVIADRNYADPTPFFITGTDERVITRWNTLPTVPVTLGQPFSVAGGVIAGWDAVIYRSPGIASAAEVVDLDVASLPLYTGPLVVGGVVRYQVVPEPASAVLFATASCGLATLSFIRRRRARI